MEVGILKNYKGNPLPLLEGGSGEVSSVSIAAYDVQGPCKPDLVWKGRVYPSLKIVLPRVQLPRFPKSQKVI